MLRGIRNASSNWLGKTIMTIVMGVLIISFGVWGIADIFRGFGQSTLAKVGSTEISTDQFRQIYIERLQQIGRSVGRPLTQDQARAFGFDRQVLQQVIAEAALDEKARRMGLGQSEAETMRAIAADPNFRGPNGAFDPARFAGLLRQFGYTEPRYLAEQRRVSMRRQLAGTITAGLEPAKAMLEAQARYANEQRSIDYVKLEAAQAGAIEAPSDDTLAAYYNDHKAQFRAPEYRKVAVAVLTPDSIMKWNAVSDEDARKVYDQHSDRYATPEKRQVFQIVFPNVEEAQSARQRLGEQFSFEDLAKERGLSATDIDLGTVTKAGMVDPAVAEAAFALKPEEVSQPVQGRFGVALLKIGKIEPGSQQSFETVAGAIKRDLGMERARASLNELHNKMEDARGGGASVLEAGEKLGLAPVTIEAMDRSGRAPNGAPAPGIPPGLDLAGPVFANDVGVDTEALPYNGGYVWFDVLGVTPSRERSLDEVKDQVEARWRADQIASRLRTKAAEMVQKLETGATLAAVAEAEGLKVETASAFKRSATPAGLPSAAVAAAFRTPKDGVGQTQGGASEWIVFRVTDVIVPDVDLASDDIKKMKDELDRRLGDEQVAEYVAKLEADLGTKINEQAFAQATGAASN